MIRGSSPSGGENDERRSPILSRLRTETRELHQKLEKAVDLPKRLASVDVYASLLETFYGLYEPLESQLALHRNECLEQFGAERLKKHQLLEADLQTLGYSGESIASIPRCTRLPNLTADLAAVGCLYVLEGSTLGGQVVRREIGRRLQLPAEGGCLFFNSYGPRVPEMWAQFCTSLTAVAGADGLRCDSIVLGASETFASFEEWMR